MKKVSFLLLVFILIFTNTIPLCYAEETLLPIEAYTPEENNFQKDKCAGGLLLKAECLGEVGYTGYSPLNNSLSATSKLPSIEEYLEQELLLHKDKITVSQYNMSINELENIYYNLIHHKPELLAYSYISYYLSGDIVTSIIPLYVTNSQAEDITARKLMNDKIDEYISYAENCPDLIGKLLLIHDKLVYDMTYDHESIATGSWNSHHAYQLFSQNTAVCQGMSQGLHMIAKKLGIEGEFISSPESELNHIWNAFKIDGKWYQVDITWDDIDDATTSRHSFFLVSDEKMAETHNSKDTWYTFTGTLPTCNDTKYESEYFFNLPSLFTTKYENNSYSFYYIQPFTDGTYFTADFNSTTLYQGPIITFLPFEQNMRGCTWIFFSEDVTNASHLYSCHIGNNFVGAILNNNISFSKRTFVKVSHARSSKSKKLSHIFWDLNTMTPLSKKITIN